MDTNRIEDFPSHWKATLLGKDFWKDAERFNQPIHDGVEASRSVTHHTKPSFAPSPPRNPLLGTSAKQDEPVKKQRRRFSMSDALSLNSPSPSTLNSLSPSGVFDLTKHPPLRSQSRSPTRAPRISSETRRHRALLRTPFNMASSKSKKREKSEFDLPPQQLGIPTHPLLHFRGGATWSRLPRTLPTLALDLFHPVRPDQETEETILPLDELAPLCQFRGLRVLKLTGMMQSYQRYIWQAAWLNPELEELELGMALEPRLRRREDGQRWPYIRGGWTLDAAHYGEPVYYGHLGAGTLHPHLGAGEYLDKTAFEKAKVRAMAVGRTPHRLPLRTLTLTNFVVDADPFIHWFDPARLRCIHFRDYCVDAGFYLPWPMRGVRIVYPREAERVVAARVVDVRREVRVVELRGGRKVGEGPYRGVQGGWAFSALQGQGRGLLRRIGELKGQKREESGSRFPLGSGS
ncbi:uncharacterized protein ACLA_066130 [Aspergillus clavatus NRRL 1]|uniref:Uncharacterized protein n=1 Tax=Aspergillus clavatus (strain ATCC 1007 / CBS 513.65 / DSM 816 / NCTC 3887 / NRRL 1 / QM 1276 / 107) TaxID=344612 RepID=A1CG97_ASPCL|nr:uncharacterized protein ACLA_066130 [Aspergillus clavatus NRRL 1]EAW10977.1 conserved hypothetical protein [Aspergillus clavatus NRRL 1]